MVDIVVDIADMQVSNRADGVIVTYALGSCIAVMVHDPTLTVAGMIHYMLPQASISPDRAMEKPAMFADTGVPMLFKAMYSRGCKKENMVVKVAGGGAIYDDHGVFEIGRRNYAILRKLFWKNGVTITAEDVGGAKSRTVRLSVGTGKCVVNSHGEETQL